MRVVNTVTPPLPQAQCGWAAEGMYAERICHSQTAGGGPAQRDQGLIKDRGRFTQHSQIVESRPLPASSRGISQLSKLGSGGLKLVALDESRNLSHRRSIGTGDGLLFTL